MKLSRLFLCVCTFTLIPAIFGQDSAEIEKYDESEYKSTRDNKQDEVSMSSMKNKLKDIQEQTQSSSNSKNTAVNDQDTPLSVDDAVFKGDVLEKLSAEGLPEEVETIKLSKGEDGKYRCIFHYRNSTIFEGAAVDNAAALVKLDSLSRYTKADGIVFDGITFDEGIISAFENCGMGMLPIKNIILLNCRNAHKYQAKLHPLFLKVKNLKSLIISLPTEELFPSELFASLVTDGKCKDLSLLCLSFNSISKEDADVVSSAIEHSDGHLKTLYLTVRKAEQGVLNKISEKLQSANAQKSENEYAGVKNLESLGVSFGDIPCEDVATFFDSLKSVQKLKTAKIDLDLGLFVNDGIYAVATSMAKFLQQQKHLEELDMSGSNLPPASYAKIFQDGLVDKDLLKVLKLDGVENITSENVDILSQRLSGLPRLVLFSLAGCKMTQDTFGKLSGAISNLPSIQSLILDKNKISNLGDIPSKCTNLINLSFVDNLVDGKGIVDAIKKSFDTGRKNQIILNFKGAPLDENQLKEVLNEYTKHLVSKPDKKPMAFCIS